MNRFQEGCSSLFFPLSTDEMVERLLVKASAEAPRQLAAEIGGGGEGGLEGERRTGCMYSCACGQHLCTCGMAAKVYGDQCEQLFPLHFKRRSVVGHISPPTGLFARKRVGSKANETAIAQTHPADPWILIWLSEWGRVQKPKSDGGSSGKGSEWTSWL